jgi:hypothetical protein
MTTSDSLFLDAPFLQKSSYPSLQSKHCACLEVRLSVFPENQSIDSHEPGTAQLLLRLHLLFSL